MGSKQELECIAEKYNIPMDNWINLMGIEEYVRYCFSFSEFAAGSRYKYYFVIDDETARITYYSSSGNGSSSEITYDDFFSKCNDKNKSYLLCNLKFFNRY